MDKDNRTALFPAAAHPITVRRSELKSRLEWGDQLTIIDVRDRVHLTIRTLWELWRCL